MKRTAWPIAIVLASALVAALALALTGPALGARRDWEPDLKAQLIDEYDCELEFVTGLIEREVDGVPIVILRAHCKDGRAFDAVRDSPELLFDLRACNVITC